MAVTGVSEEQYKNFLSHGGNLTFEIDALDIDVSGEFEKSPLIAPFLESGFEIKPSAIIENDKEAAQILSHGDSWTRVIAFTYRRSGSVIYKKLSSGRYEAQVNAPAC